MDKHSFLIILFIVVMLTCAYFIVKWIRKRIYNQIQIAITTFDENTLDQEKLKKLRRTARIYFIVILFLILGLYIYISDLYSIFRFKYFYIQTTCQIQKNELVSHKWNVFVSYKVNNKEYNEWVYNLGGQLNSNFENKQIMSQLSENSSAPCWYDPWHPSRVVLLKIEDEVSVLWLPLYFIVCFIVVFIYVIFRKKQEYLINSKEAMKKIRDKFK